MNLVLDYFYLFFAMSLLAMLLELISRVENPTTGIADMVQRLVGQIDLGNQ